jgi:threonine/homoserine/homoserine lactone efflux protein
MAAASPGPSFVLVAQTAVGSGRRAGLLAAFAMMLGAVIWAAAALYGLQALFARFEWLYLAMRIGGGLYLLYLAVMLWRHAPEPLPEPSAAGDKAGAVQGFVRALLLQLGNPKVMVFFGSIFLALLPAHPPTGMQIATLAIVAFNEFTWYALITLLFSGGPARTIYRRAKFWLDRIMGGALALLGLRLALLSR